MRELLIVALVALSAFVGGCVVNEVVIDPLQAESRDVVDGKTAPETERDAEPTVEHLCRGALHSTQAQAEKLEQMIDVKWGQTSTP